MSDRPTTPFDATCKKSEVDKLLANSSRLQELFKKGPPPVDPSHVAFEALLQYLFGADTPERLDFEIFATNLMADSIEAMAEQKQAAAKKAKQKLYVPRR